MKKIRLLIQKALQILDFDIRVRYQPVCAYLRKMDPTGKDSVLEVGSGSLGITRYLKRNVTGFDKEFVETISPYLHPIKGDALKLPFENGSFDHVVSVDLLEHLSLPDRVLAIPEMVRVARKGVVIVVPSSKESEEAERRLSSVYKNRGKEIPEWLSEHLSNGLPTSEEILEAISSFEKRYGKHLKVEVSSNQSLWMWSFGTWLFTRGTIPFLLTMMLFWCTTPTVFFLSRLGRPYRKVFIISK